MGHTQLQKALPTSSTTAAATARMITARATKAPAPKSDSNAPRGHTAAMDS